MVAEKMCPLAGKAVPCSEAKCAWWFAPYNYRNKCAEPGRCAILELAQSAWGNS